MKNLIITCFFILVFDSSVKAQEILSGTATNVYDGDTFTLITDDDEKVKIRIVGIDAPEAKQEYGIASRDFARNILDKKRVRVYLEPGETYGRKLGVVITQDGIHFNYEMVASGNAWWYSNNGKYSTDKFLKAAMKDAQEKRKGLWASEDPQAPWEWRRANN